MIYSYIPSDQLYPWYKEAANKLLLLAKDDDTKRKMMRYII